MNLSNNQPIANTPQPEQSAPTPMHQPTPAPEPIITSAPVPQTPKTGGKKGIVLLIILILLIIGMGLYVFFANNQLQSSKKASIDNTSTVIPTAMVPTSTPAAADEIDVESPETDLNAIEGDVQGL